jgi:hypothetical protein
MTHAIENSFELWHRRLAHINYKALPYICKTVTCLPELKVDHEGVKAVGSAEREREAQIFKNLRERERFGSVFYIIHKKYIFYMHIYIYIYMQNVESIAKNMKT